MPLWLCYSIIFILTCTTLFFVYRTYSNKRYIRITYFVGLAGLYFSARVFTFVVKVPNPDPKLTLDLSAALGGASFTGDLVAVVIFVCLFFWEKDIIKNESCQAYFGDFTTVAEEKLINQLPAKEISENHKLSLEKVNAVIMCIYWFDQERHRMKLKQENIE